MHRMLLEGTITEYHDRATFEAAVSTDWLVTFDDNVGDDFKSSAVNIQATDGSFPFSLEGSESTCTAIGCSGTVLTSAIPVHMDGAFAWLFFPKW